MNEYEAEQAIDICGTAFYNHTVRASYDELVRVLGPHNSNGDNYKVTTEWTVRGPDGVALTIYDWKETCQYDDSSDSPTVEDLRQGLIIAWHIGARDAMNALMFKGWLNDKLEVLRNKCAKCCGVCGGDCDG